MESGRKDTNRRNTRVEIVVSYGIQRQGVKMKTTFSTLAIAVVMMAGLAFSQETQPASASPRPKPAAGRVATEAPAPAPMNSTMPAQTVAKPSAPRQDTPQREMTDFSQRAETQ